MAICIESRMAGTMEGLPNKEQPFAFLTQGPEQRRGFIHTIQTLRATQNGRV